MSQNQPSLFVAIANYRDREITATISDLFRQAARPELIRVGVLSQLMPGDEACRAPVLMKVDEKINDPLPLEWHVETHDFALSPIVHLL